MSLAVRPGRAARPHHRRPRTATRPAPTSASRPLRRTSTAPRSRTGTSRSSPACSPRPARSIALGGALYPGHDRHLKVWWTSSGTAALPAFRHHGSRGGFIWGAGIPYTMTGKHKTTLLLDERVWRRFQEEVLRSEGPRATSAEVEKAIGATEIGRASCRERV